MEKIKYKNSKTLCTQYAVKLNSEVVCTKPTKKECKEFIRNIKLTSDIYSISLVRQNITEYEIKTWVPEEKLTLLTVDQLGLED